VDYTGIITKEDCVKINRTNTLRTIIFIFMVATLLGFTSTVAMAQVRPAMVRSVDEPARVPYSYSVEPTYPFSNQAVYTFPSVPTGKRLRLTNVRAVFLGTNAPAFFAVSKNTYNNLLVMFPLTPFSGAYFGDSLSISQDVDLIFETGEAPVLQLGISSGAGGISSSFTNHFGVTGYMVDLLP
jgi:hypothetical protein